MSVSDYTYGTAALVHGKIGWVVPGRDRFTKNTTPSDTEVEAVLNQIASDIHMKMAENGYPVDTKADVTTNAPRAVAWLERLNVAGACADILQAFPVANDEESGSSPEKYWSSAYKNGLKLIEGKALEEMGLTKTTALSSGLVCTSVLDEDGNAKQPIFRRNMWSPEGEKASINQEDE